MILKGFLLILKEASLIQWNAETQQLACIGEWNIDHLVQLKKALKKISLPAGRNITLNGDKITRMDSAGAWLLDDWLNKLSEKKITSRLIHFSEQHQKLLSIIQKKSVSEKSIPKIKLPDAIARLGKSTLEQLREMRQFLSFVGQLTTEAFRIIKHPSHLRLKAIVGTIDKTGYQALPIIALLSFMIGVVISYQMGNKLRNYGANVFIVDLLGLSVLREFGPLLTAIMVAGRTGSAFTAQLGIMKINQEIDALNTMSVTPAELLLLPRLIGLVIVLPLLTIWADIFGVLGGMLMANNMLGVTWHEFLQRFQHAIPVRALIIGLGKAPVFALLIGSIGCFQGMQVQGSAESVGKRTTKSVVLAIFFIIVADAIFSIIFSKFKL